jgi:hypothetical protein
MRWERACTPERLATEKLRTRRPRLAGVALCRVGGDEPAVLLRMSRRRTPTPRARRANVALGAHHEVSR